MMGFVTCRWYRSRLARRRIAAGAGDTRAHRHVRSCGRCQKVLGDGDLIAGELAELKLPDPSSARLWRQIESRLDGETATDSPEQRTAARLGAAGRWVLDESPTWAVAIVAVLALLSVWQAREWASSGPSAVEVPGGAGQELAERGNLQLSMVPISLDVGSYVREVSRSSAPDEFWSAYRASDPEPNDPYRNLDFAPIVPEQLPHGFRLVDSKLLRDACCQTLQVRYAARDRWLDVFQCHDDHPIAFGEASVDRREVAGVVCTAFGWNDGEVRGRSFSLGNLSIVAVGNVTDEVLDDLVADFAGR